VNGLVCIESVLKYVLSVSSLQYTHTNLHRPIQTNTNKYVVNGLVCIQYRLYELHPYWIANLYQSGKIVLVRIDLDVFVLS